MTNASTAERRQTNWADFYKNGPPKEIIVIDDDTPPPPSLSSSSTSSSASVQHVPNGNAPVSPRYHVMQPQQYALPGIGAIGSGPSSVNSSTRVTRRTNKRLPSTELIAPPGSNGISATNAPAHRYAYAETSYAPTHPNHPQRGVYPNQHLNAVHPSSGAVVDGVVPQPAKKKRRSNADAKVAQPLAPQENHVAYYPPAPATQATGSMSNRDAPINIPPWDDKEGHYIVVPNDDFTAR
ncbi:hypothetical protein BGZ72_011198, partial [Mortierella alpina]